MDVAPVATLAVLSAVVVVGLVAVVVTVSVSRRRMEEQLRSSRAELAALRTRVEQLAAAGSPATRDPAPSGEDYLITTLPTAWQPVASVPSSPAGDPERLSGAEFVSVAVGESVVRVVCLAHGVRRALSAENRQRIRFEMRREVKRSRKQRRRDVREAQRHLRAQDAA